jgi:hypothetical protein
MTQWKKTFANHMFDKQTIICVIGDVEESEPSYTAGRNVKHSNICRK